jgi:hypothetical protein
LSPNNIAGVTTYTLANVGGSWFGNLATSSNGYAAYGWAMGLPSPGVQSTLVNATATPAVAASLANTGSSIFGAGVLGANYSSTSTGTISYTVTNTHEYDLTGSNALTLGLLSIAGYNGGFKSLSFTVTDGSTTLLPTMTFRNLPAAETYFTDDPVSLGDVSGPTDVTLTYKLTASSPEGAGISYVVAEVPAGAAAKSSVPFTFGGPSEQREREPDARVMIASDHSTDLTSILARINASYVVADNVAVPRFAHTAAQYRRSELLKELLAKTRH